VEKFLSAKPLPLTDVAIGADGAMYFTTGGRRIQSGFYRVVYRGSSDTAPVREAAKLTYEQALRQQMEMLHRDDAPAAAIDTIWNLLDHADRFVRQAARIALEHQPVERWRERALREAQPARAANALMALSRHAAEADRGAIVDALAAIDPGRLDAARRSMWVRDWDLAFARLGRPTDGQRAAALAVLDPMYPSGDTDLDAQLVDLLVYLHAPGVIARALDRMDELASGTPPAWADLVRRNDQYGSAIRAMLDAPPPTAQMQIARALSFMDVGWTMPQRQRYLSLINRAAGAGGGMSFGGYVDRMRERHLASCTDEERAMLAPMVHPPESTAEAPVVLPVGPGRVWTVDGAVAALEADPDRPDPVRGAGLFRASQCVNCHTMAGKGANAGPDLTSAGNKFSRTDILRAIIEPSASVTDQYAISVVTLRNGQVRRGLMVGSDEQAVHLAIDFLNPERTVDVPRSEIASIEPSPVSPMPPGLANALNPRELRDLVAYVLSGG
jgi:putative heme-binding domain-containing protein